MLSIGNYHISYYYFNFSLNRDALLMEHNPGCSESNREVGYYSYLDTYLLNGTLLILYTSNRILLKKRNK